MNTNMVDIIKRIIAEQGEAVLGDAPRLKGIIADYASRESKKERIAFGHCIEYGAYAKLKGAMDRQAAKAAIAQRVNAGEGIEIALCNDALDVLETALFGEKKPKKALCLKCGRELEAGWAVCPFCGAGSAAAEMKPTAPESSLVTAGTPTVTITPTTQTVTPTTPKTDWGDVVGWIVLTMVVVAVVVAVVMAVAGWY
jgi:hypothetical protein